MATKTGSLNYWRNYFRTANSDIFDIIDHAIMVAASDCPKEFKLRRDRIAERLFSCRLTRCSGCDKMELAVPGGDGEDDDDDGGCKSGFDRDGGEVEAGASKESKVNSSRDDQGEMNMNQLSNYSYGLAEALTAEIEEESEIVGEVFRIKEIFNNCEEESDTVLFESLRKLQLMALNVETLKATEIGKAVNGLRKHGSKKIRHLARSLIDGWKDMVDEWVNATTALAGTEAMSDSVNPSFDDEEGLPSPPLDEGAFFATQTTSMELSQFFDGMDDFGNPRNNRDNGRKPSVEKQNIVKQKQQPSNEANVLPKENKNEQVKKQEVVKPNKLSNTDSGPGRPPKVNMEQKVNNETKIQQKTDKVAIQKRQLNGQQDVSAVTITCTYTYFNHGRILLAKVDCTEEGDLCKRNHIQGYPSIRIFRKGSDVRDDHGHHEHESYYGDRDTDSLVKTMETLVAPIPVETQKLALDGKSDNGTDNAKRPAPLTGGCRIEGYVRVKKVPGNLVISAHSGAHSFDASQMNMSHVISHFSFGRMIAPKVMSDVKRLVPYLGGSHERLNGRSFINHRDLGANVTIEHYLQIVKSEVITGRNHKLIEEYEYTAHSSLVQSLQIPVAKFHFELSPMQVLITENQKSFSHFITNVCAIIGGVFTVAGIVDSILHNTIRMMRKVELGKIF